MRRQTKITVAVILGITAAVFLFAFSVGGQLILLLPQGRTATLTVPVVVEPNASREVQFDVQFPDVERIVHAQVTSNDPRRARVATTATSGDTLDGTGVLHELIDKNCSGTGCTLRGTFIITNCTDRSITANAIIGIEGAQGSEYLDEDHTVNTRTAETIHTIACT